MIIDRNNKVYSTVKRKFAYSVQKQIYMVYQGKMDLRKIKNSISQLKEDIYDIRYALVIITIYIIVTQIIFGSGCPMVIALIAVLMLGINF